MKQHYLLGMGMFVAMLAACTDEDQSVSALHEGGLKATVESNRISSRAGFTTGEENKGAFYWSKDDKIGVTTTVSKSGFSALAMDESGIGQSSATFNGAINGTLGGYAVYPYDDQHSMDGSTLTYHFKPEYTYSKVDADFATGKQGEGNSFNPPMWGNIANGTVALRHLGAVCCIKIDKLPTGTDLKLTLTSDKKINGTYTVNLASKTPQIEAAATTETTEKTVTITFSNNNENASGVFYVPLPVGEHTLRLKVLDSGSEKINAALGTFNITRTLLKRLDLANGSINAGGATEVSNASEVEKALGSSDIVAVTGAINSNTEVKIPPTSTTGKAKSVTFESVGNAKLTVTDAAAQGGTSVEKLTLAFAANETVQEDNEPTLVVNTPNSTTTLEATSGTLKLKEATASTADNTLVVGAGVTIKKLIVQKGNIRAKKGSVITEITRSASNTNTYILYKEDGATLPFSIPEGFTVVDAAIADLLNVAKEGGTYTLTKDLTGDFTISATNDVIINLNGHKITNKSGDTFTVNKGSKLTISGSGAVDNVTHQKACIYNNGTVILNGGTYTRSKENGINKENSGDNSYYNILNHGEMTINSGVEVSQGGHFSSMIANGYYDYTNKEPRSGYVNDTNHQNPSLTINGGTFSGGLNTIKNDDGAKLTIVDGTFANMSQATVQNHHVTEIKGGTFNTTGSAQYAVDNKGHNGEENDLGQMTISGGMFNGKIYVSGVGASLTITGGAFSDPGALAYLGDNANVTVKLNDDTELTKSIVVEKGNATIDLNTHTLTATSAATVEIKANTNKVVAIAVKDGAKATVKNGNIGDNTNKLSYGVYAFGKANVTLNNVSFSEMVTYAYNGAGTLAATGCTFKGWLSGWHQGGTFTDCTFTIGKAYYPATICYGSTTFTSCKFLKNDVDADAYDNSNNADEDGYYRCNYVVAQCNPSKSIAFTNCKFISENNEEAGSVAKDNHPFHACGWGNGTAANYNVTVDGTAVTSLCSDATESLNENK